MYSKAQYCEFTKTLNIDSCMFEVRKVSDGWGDGRLFYLEQGAKMWRDYEEQKYTGPRRVLLEGLSYSPEYDVHGYCSYINGDAREYPSIAIVFCSRFEVTLEGPAAHLFGIIPGVLLGSHELQLCKDTLFKTPPDCVLSIDVLIRLGASYAVARCKDNSVYIYPLDGEPQSKSWYRHLKEA